MTENDKVVQALNDKVQALKKEVEKAKEKPSWKTNSSFPYRKDASPHDRTNIQVVNDCDEIANMLAFLLEKEKAYNEARLLLGLSPEKFKWSSFTVEDWTSDFKTRINSLTLKQKEETLKKLESKLNSLVSKEMRDKLELEEIQKSLDTL